MFDNSNYFLLSPFKKPDLDYNSNIQRNLTNSQEKNFLNQKRNRDDNNNNCLTFSPGGNMISYGLKPMTPLFSANIPKSPNLQPVFMFDPMVNPFNNTPTINKNGVNLSQFYYPINNSNTVKMEHESIPSNEKTETVQTPSTLNDKNIVMVNVPNNNLNFYNYLPFNQIQINNSNNNELENFQNNLYNYNFNYNNHNISNSNRNSN